MLAPAAEHDVDANLVRTLLAEQHPDLAHLAVRFVAEGWDTSLWRVGDTLAARLPRRAVVEPQLVAEQRWLPVLAPRLPLPVPVPVRLGSPGGGYPWRWSVVPWLDGATVLDGAPLDGPRAARSLGAFLRALHVAAPPDAPASEIRGVPVDARTPTLEAVLGDLDGPDEVRAVRAVWSRGLDAPPHAGAPVWVHGDLHHGNVLARDGDVVGVIDFVDLNSGDPATDLAAAWLLLDPGDAPALLDAYGGADDALVARARAWAVLFAVLFVSIGRGGLTRYGACGRAALRAVLASEP
jgi:aminoglycoside phosphotransferase (APT) family kinase protein